MKLFIRWSGESSRKVAEALRGWIPNVIQSVEPWMSADDIEKGLRWSSEIAAQLEQTDFGIVCLTPDNLDAPWLMFETGALSKTLDKAFVCPFLFGLEPTSVKGPLAQFQATKAEKSETRKLIQTINRACGDSALSVDRIDKAFEQWWSGLEQALRDVPLTGATFRSRPSDADLLQEILEIVRADARESRAFSKMRDDFVRVFSNLLEVGLQSDPTVRPQMISAIEGLKRSATAVARLKPASYVRTHKIAGERVVTGVMQHSNGLYRVQIYGTDVREDTMDFEALYFAQAFADKTAAALGSDPHYCNEQTCSDWIILRDDD